MKESLLVTTDDPNDPRLKRGVDQEPTPQSEAYLILSDRERKQGFVRPFRNAYQHLVCGSITTMAKEIAETYAANPKFYGATYCVHCQRHLPVDEFVWIEHGLPTDIKVGT